MEKTIRRGKLYKIWNQVPPDYYQAGIKTNLFQWIWHTHKISRSKKIMKNLHYRHCLDVGCAGGYMISELFNVNSQAKYFGVDIYDEAINYAKKKYPRIKFYLANADKMPFRSRSLDLVISYETIEHLKNPKAFLREVRRILNRNGTFILAMDSGNWLFKIIWFCWEHTLGRVWQGAHLNTFHHSELEGIVKKAAFKIDKKIFTHFGLEVVLVLKKESA